MQYFQDLGTKIKDAKKNNFNILMKIQTLVAIFM